MHRITAWVLVPTIIVMVFNCQSVAYYGEEFLVSFNLCLATIQSKLQYCRLAVVATITCTLHCMLHLFAL